MAVDAIGRYARRRAGVTGERVPPAWVDGVRPDEVLFLDDIGENCAAAQREGLQVIKVDLGHTARAVQEMERVLGERLPRGEGGESGEKASGDPTRARL